MTRIRARAAILALVLVLPAAVAGCGGDGGGDSEDPNQVLEQTFNNPTRSPAATSNISLDGSAREPVGSLTATSTVRSRAIEISSRIPQLDLTANP